MFSKAQKMANLIHRGTWGYRLHLKYNLSQRDHRHAFTWCCHFTVHVFVSNWVCLSWILRIYDNYSLVYNFRVKGSLWRLSVPQGRCPISYSPQHGCSIITGTSVDILGSSVATFVHWSNRVPLYGLIHAQQRFHENSWGHDDFLPVTVISPTNSWA